MKQLVVVWLLSLSGAVSAMASDLQTCDPQASNWSTPAHAFHDNGDATVTHRPSRLQWMRCSMGQVWMSGQCQGVAQQVSWPQAREHAERINREGQFFFNDWRLPNMREMALITERACRNPRINLQVFPQTPAAAYWTGGLKSVGGYEPQAFFMDFGPGGMGHDDQQRLHYVRLVRISEQ